jgi:hypothetical protein
MELLGSRSNRRAARQLRRRYRRRNMRRRDRMGFVDKQDPVWKKVPGEDGCEFGFAVLSGDEMDEAQVRNIERTLTMDISDGMARALIKTPERTESEEKPIEFRDCNDAVLVDYGLVAWKGGIYEGKPCDTAHRKRLTAEVFKWAAREVFNLSHLTAGEGSSSEPSGKDEGDRTHNGSEPASSSRSRTSVESSVQG